MVGRPKRSNSGKSSRPGARRRSTGPRGSRPPRAGFGMILAAVVLGVGLGVALALYANGKTPQLSFGSPSSGGAAKPRTSRSARVDRTERRSTDSSRPISSPSHDAVSIEPSSGDSAPTPAEVPVLPPKQEPGSVKPSLENTPTELVRGNPRGTQVALTFDAGSSAEPTPAILKALDDAGVKATFFLTGKWCEKYPKMAARIVAAGHEIANHTYGHERLPNLSDEAIVEELQKADECIYNATGQHTVTWFRPPFGARDKRVLEVAAKAGYRSAYWTLDSWDSVKRDITGAEIENRVIIKLAAGDVVLMHCGSEATSQALPGILRAVRTKGLQAVKVSELGE